MSVTSIALTTTPRRGRAIGPRLVTLAVVFVLGLGGLAGLEQLFVSGNFTSGVPLGSFLRGYADDAGYVSYQVGSLKHDAPAHLPIYLLGGSGTRECIQDPEDLERAIASRCHIATTVIDLGSSNQSLAETLAIVDNLRPTGGVVVIAVNHTRFAYTLRDAENQLWGNEMLLRSPTLHDFLAAETGRDLSASILPGIRFYFAIYGQRRGVAPFKGPPLTYMLHRYGQVPLWSHAKKLSRVALWLSNRGRRGGEFDTNRAFNGRLLATIAARARRLGFSVVIMESPQDKSIVGHRFDRFKAAYQPLCRAVAADNAGRYIDPNVGAGLVDGDFRDLAHLVPTGRVKWTPVLARTLVPSVRQAAADAASRSH